MQCDWCCKGWCLSFHSGFFVFFGHVLESWFNLVKHCFGCLGRDAGCWVSSVALNAMATSTPSKDQPVQAKVFGEAGKVEVVTTALNAGFCTDFCEDPAPFC